MVHLVNFWWAVSLKLITWYRDCTDEPFHQLWLKGSLQLLAILTMQYLEVKSNNLSFKREAEKWL